MTNIKNKVLVVDDEPQIRKLLRVTLEASGYKVEESSGGNEALRLAASLKPDLIILDLGLPDLDGSEVIKKIREWSQVPILVLSVRAQDDDIVLALNSGADDYVVKPFSIDVLLARLRAVLRKSVREEAGGSEMVNGPLKMDLLRHEVYRNGEVLPLSPKEYELLRYFMTHKGRMLTHKQILKEVWGPAHADDTQYLRVYIGQLRQKIEPDPAHSSYIVNEPGIGYRMEEHKKTSAAA